MEERERERRRRREKERVSFVDGDIGDEIWGKEKVEVLLFCFVCREEIVE